MFVKEVRLLYSCMCFIAYMRVHWRVHRRVHRRVRVRVYYSRQKYLKIRPRLDFLQQRRE